MTVREMLKILSDTNRLRILNLLYIQELCVCELEYLLTISQSNLSKHLRLMGEIGFLDSRRQNKFIYYKINESILREHPFLISLFETELNREAFFLDELKKLTHYQNSGLTCHNITALL
ncbi:ArsR/SmtB family transcription factor [Acetobacterium woodii]|nr:metalloregulator ArsR/SmtB family transcription factor [Acetobacterium woodii]